MMGTWTEEEHQRFVDQKRASRMAMIDAMSPEMRALVNEYGLSVVHACLELGVRKPRQIKHLVETVLNEFSPTRGSYSQQGIRTQVERA